MIEGGVELVVVFVVEGVDAENEEAHRELSEEFVVMEFDGSAVGWVVEVVLTSDRKLSTGTVVVLAGIAFEGDVADLFREILTDLLFDEISLGEDRHPFCSGRVEVQHALTRHMPREFTVENPGPFASEFLNFGVGTARKTADVDDEGRLGEEEVVVEEFERVTREEVLHRFFEDFFDGDVEGANRAVEIDRPEEVGAGFDEVDECRQAAGMHCQALRREEAVVEHSPEVEGFGVVARHVGVAQDEVHVVDGIDAGKHGAEFTQPVGMSVVLVVVLRAFDEPGDLTWVEDFQLSENATGVASDSLESFAEHILDDMRADIFVSQAVLGEVVIVEEVTERAMANVVKQGSHANEALDIGL